jgi:hypothetical protein
MGGLLDPEDEDITILQNSKTSGTTHLATVSHPKRIESSAPML